MPFWKIRWNFLKTVVILEQTINHVELSRKIGVVGYLWIIMVDMTFKLGRSRIV
jgi:hypothetical protein